MFKMKIIMLSTDENIFKEGSEVRSRMFEYGKLAEELHVVIKNQKSKIKNQNFGNIFLYPTNNRFMFLYFFNAYKIAKKIIVNCKLEIDNCVVTTQDPFETGLIGYFLKKKFKIPLQIQIHTDFLSPYFWCESLKNKIRVILAKKIIQSANGIRVVSERIKKSLVISHWSLRDKISILPIFVDIQKIKSTPIKTDLHKKYPGRFIILMASRLTREKNIKLAIKSAKILTPKHSNLLFLIVGSGPERKNLKSQISNLKLQNNIVLEDWTDDLASYYKTADLFLLTSNYEGYGMTVVEATSAGLPVLMTDVGIAIGSVVPVDDVKKLTGYLSVLIDDALEREKNIKDQKKILDDMPSRDEYCDLIKKSWQNCFS